MQDCCSESKHCKKCSTDRSCGVSTLDNSCDLIETSHFQNSFYSKKLLGSFVFFYFCSIFVIIKERVKI